VEMNGVTIRDIGEYNGGLGLFSTRELKEGTVVVSFPTGYVVHTGYAYTIPVLKHLFKEYPLSESNKFALFLVFEKNVNPSSRWKPYLDSLPRNFSTTLFFSQEDLKELKGTYALKFIERRNQSLKEKYKEISEVILTDFRLAFTEETLTESEFFWGISIVFSRAMSVALIGQSGKWNKYDCVVPLVDLFNTGEEDEINVKCRTNEDSTHVDCFTTTVVPPGTELLRPYDSGGLSNMRLLMDYGFALENNKNDKLILGFPDLEVTNKKLKEEFFSKVDPSILELYEQDTDE